MKNLVTQRIYEPGREGIETIATNVFLGPKGRTVIYIKKINAYRNKRRRNGRQVYRLQNPFGTLVLKL